MIGIALEEALGEVVKVRSHLIYATNDTIEVEKALTRTRKELENISSRLCDEVMSLQTTLTLCEGRVKKLTRELEAAIDKLSEARRSEREED